MKHIITMILSFFIIFVGCATKNPLLVTIDQNKYIIADFKDFYQFSPADDSISRLEKIDEFVNQMLMVKEAQARGYETDPVVTTAYETHRRDVIAFGYYENQVAKKVKISDSEVRKMYQQIIEQYNLAQIVVTAESLANYISSQIKAGVPFESLVSFSIDPTSKTNNGVIGPVSAISLPPDFQGILKKIKIGKSTKPIKFGDYFYILKVLDHKMSDKPLFEEVSNNIRGGLLKQKSLELGNKFTQDILEKASIEYNQEGLEVFNKPESLITEADLNKWVVKKYDTAYVYVRSIIDAVLYQYRQSHIDPKRLIDRVLIPDLIYDAAIKVHFDMNQEIKRRLRNAMSLLLNQKLYSDFVLEKANVDSMAVVNFYKKHKTEYKDKKISDAYTIIRTNMRDAQIDSLRKILFAELKEKYKPVINEVAVTQLLKEEM